MTRTDDTVADVAAQLGLPWDHQEYVCTVEHEDGGWNCQFCAGGLFACKECGSFEGATTSQCPGVQMNREESDLVYAGRLDFRNGYWVDKPSLHCPDGIYQLRERRLA